MAEAQLPSTTRASLSSTGAQGDGSSHAATISADGRYVAFASVATNLVAGDTNGIEDIFLRDRLTGETRRVNLTPDGAQANGGTTNDLPEISADGRYVVFRSDSPSLVAGSTGFQLFLYDRAANSVRRVAAPPAAAAFPFDVSISADGSRVAYTAANGTATVADVFVADTAAGTVRRVSETATGTPGDGVSAEADISADGRWVGFTTAATNLAGADANGVLDVLVRDLQSGSLTRVSIGAGGAEANQESRSPALSRDGCIVAFSSSASNLVTADDGARPKVFVRDRCGAETEVASVSNSDTRGAAARPVDLSDDGCLVAFAATTILSPPPAIGYAAGLRDRCAGTTSRLDLAGTGEPGTGDVAEVRLSGGTGRYAVFPSSAANLVAGDTNGAFDVFVRDRATNVAPVAELTLTRDGRRVSADATASRDPDGFVVTGAIAFGDGSTEQLGLRATREYARGGTYSVTVTVKDADGLSSTRTLPVTVPDAAAPPPPAPPPIFVSPRPPDASMTPPALVLDRVGLSRTRFELVPRGGRVGGTRGARLALRLSDAATLELRFERRLTGRRVRGRCVTGSRSGTRCVRYAAAATLRRALAAGRRTVVLTGRVGARVLRPGRYRLRIVARSADGRRSATSTLTLTITQTRFR